MDGYGLHLALKDQEESLRKQGRLAALREVREWIASHPGDPLVLIDEFIKREEER